MSKISALASRESSLLFRDKVFRNLLNTFVTDRTGASNLAIITNSGSYSLTGSEAGKLIRQDTAGANNVTVPPDSTTSFTTGTQIHITNAGAGQTTIVAGEGVTINSA